MTRTLRRPMFRKGGMAQEPRTGYMGGGMSGIMSGITPRQPDAGLTPRMGLQEGSEPFKNFEEFQGYSDFKINQPKILTEEQINDKVEKGKTLDKRFIKDFGFLDFLRQDVGSMGKDLAYESSNVGKQEYRDELIKINEANKNLYKKYKIPYDGDVSGNTVPPSMRIDGQSDLENTQTKITDGTGTDGGGQQSDLENIQDYMKMFEAAAAGDPDDARKSKYLELAKFGANLIAQPGGDLVGSIGKAASSSIGGLSKQMADEAATKKSAKLMGLKAGLSQTDMGEFGKKIKALAKFSGRSEEDVAKKFLSGDGDFDKIYLEGAEQAGVEAGQAQLNYLSNIKTMANKRPDIAAKLNKGFPKKNPVEGEYYVLPGGEFTRFVDGEKLKPSDPGFYDKED